MASLLFVSRPVLFCSSFGHQLVPFLDDIKSELTSLCASVCLKATLSRVSERIKDGDIRAMEI